ncbi:hypothetical protein RYX36_012147 [Vicia faba]
MPGFVAVGEDRCVASIKGGAVIEAWRMWIDSMRITTVWSIGGGELCEDAGTADSAVWLLLTAEQLAFDYVFQTFFFFSFS